MAGTSIDLFVEGCFDHLDVKNVSIRSPHISFRSYYLNDPLCFVNAACVQFSDVNNRGLGYIGMLHSQQSGQSGSHCCILVGS